MTRSWLDGLRDRASTSVPDRVMEYIDQGSAASVSADEAAAAWQQIRFAPRVLRDVTTVDLSTRFLDMTSAVPWGVAPSTLQRQVHPEGEVAMARACADAGAPMVVSSNAGTRFATIADTGVDWWVQAYLTQDRELTLPLLADAVAAGARAVVLTVDTPVVATKRTASGAEIWDLVPADQLRVNFPEGHEDSPGSEKAGDLCAADIRWLTERTGLPVVVKGVLRGDDASSLVDAGVAAIWVSNHGGRQLDRAVSTAEALPEVVSEVDGRAQVYVDGGLRDGHDMLAALALGADAVFLGRQPLWALAQGQTGVTRMHAELGTELIELLRLVGAANPRETCGTAVKTLGQNHPHRH